MHDIKRYDMSVPVIDGRGPQKQMHSGRMVHVLSLTPEEVEPSDLAHHLALYNRWTGGTNEPISVAQHSMLVADWLARFGVRLELLGLLHDAAEAYMGDICRPIKAAFSMVSPGVVEKLEAQIDGAICGRFKLAPPSDEEAALVKAADQVVTATEARDLLPRERAGETEWRSFLPQPLPVTIHPWTWRAAKRAFATRLDRLTKEIGA